MSLTVRTAVASDAAAWDAYILGAPTGTFFHRFGWRQVIEESLRQPCHFLLAERDGRIEGYAYAHAFVGRAAYDWAA